MKKYKLAIVGATGLVGRTALKVLEEKNIPNIEYTLFCSSKSAGQKITFLGKEYTAQELKDNSFDEGFDFADWRAMTSDVLTELGPKWIRVGARLALIKEH